MTCSDSIGVSRKIWERCEPGYIGLSPTPGACCLLNPKHRKIAGTKESHALPVQSRFRKDIILMLACLAWPSSSYSCAMLEG